MSGPAPAGHGGAAPRWAIALGLILLVGLVYHPVRGHDFVDLDDYVTIVTHPAHAAPLSRENVVAALTRPHHQNWIPLTSLSLQADVAAFGIDSGATLLVNAALHALGAILLWLALARLTGALWPSAIVAALFAVHPLHVESVAWASQRKDVLAGVCFGLTLWCYARYVERPGWLRHGAVTLCLALGLAAKPTLVTVPFVLLLLDAWPLDRLRDGLRGCLLEKLPWLAVAAVFGAVTFAVQSGSGATEALGAPVPLATRVGNAGLSYVAFLADAFWPSGLTVDYPHPEQRLSFAAAAAAWALILALSAVAWQQRRQRPWLGVGWLWYLGMLVPTIGFVQVGIQARADRYTYLPLTGIALAVVFQLASALPHRSRWRRAAGPAAAAALAAFALLASRQVGYWQDTLHLFRHAVEVRPDHTFAHHRLAVAYLGERDLESAARHYEEVFRLRPSWTRPRYEWAGILDQLGRLDEAIRVYQDALRIEPHHGKGHALLAMVLRRAERYAEALPHLEAAIASLPEHAPLRQLAARALAAEGHHAEAVEQLRAWQQLEPDRDEPRNDLAWALATCPDPAVRDPAEALALIEPLVERDPDAAHLLDTWAAALAASGRFGEAAEVARRAVDRAANEHLRRGYAERRDLFERGEPYIERR